MGLRPSRTLEENDLGGVWSPFCERGGLFPWVHSRSWAVGGCRLPAQVSSAHWVTGLPPLQPSTAPGCGQHYSPVVRGQVPPAIACWVPLGRVLLPFGLGFPICGGRGLGQRGELALSNPCIREAGGGGRPWLEWGREAVPWGSHWPLTFQVCMSVSVDCLCVCERVPDGVEGCVTWYGQGCNSYMPTCRQTCSE